jgi:hypothetical protein
MFADLFVQEFDVEEILALPFRAKFSLYIDLHEKDFGDLIEGGGGIKLFPVANNVVALVEQIGELVLFEGFEFRNKIFNLFVTRIGMGDIANFL